jgi:hypothetical protein
MLPQALKTEHPFYRKDALWVSGTASSTPLNIKMETLAEAYEFVLTAARLSTRSDKMGGELVDLLARRYWAIPRSFSTT